jgi:transcription antitermination protein NusB
VIPKRKQREYIYQALFAMDFFQPEEAQPLVEFVMRFAKINRKQAQTVVHEANLVRAKEGEIDPLISQLMTNYSSKHISKIELSALRLAVYEMKEGLDGKIAISEAIRIVKKFGSKEGSSFVNGVLDSVYKELKTPSLASC